MFSFQMLYVNSLDLGRYVGETVCEFAESFARGTVTDASFLALGMLADVPLP